MPRTSKANKDSKHSKRRLAALAILLCLLAVALLAEIFIVTHLNHDCLGDCLVCQKLLTAKKVLNQAKDRTAVLLIVALALITMLIVAIKQNSIKLFYLPIDKKVRINT